MPPLVLVTRPQPAADALVGRLEQLGYRALAAPMTEIERVGSLTAPDLANSTAIALTSAAAARALADDLQPAGIIALTATVFCVGEATAKAARKAGLSDVVIAGGDGAALEAAIVQARPAGGVIHLRGEDLAHDLAAGLRAHGIAAQEKVLYRAAPASGFSEMVNSALLEHQVDVTLFFSARAASVFLGLFSPESAGKPIFISERAAAAWPLARSCVDSPPRGTGQRWGLHTVASRPTLEAVLDTLHQVAPISAA